MLPHDPHEKPWYYYTILSSTTFAFDDKMVITVNIPLLDASRAFTVVEAINLPVTFPPSNVTPIYELEFEHFSASADEKQYTIMTVEDLIRCRQSGLNFCPITSAVYEPSQHEYCVFALYRKNVNEIRKFCKTSVSNMLKLPLAKYFSAGKWLVVTDIESVLTVMCNNKTKNYDLKIVPPFNLVTLESGCQAFTDTLSLPIYYERKSTYAVKEVLPGIKVTDLLIWDPIIPHLDNPSDELQMLPSVKDIPMGNLVNMIEQQKHATSNVSTMLLYI